MKAFTFSVSGSFTLQPKDAIAERLAAVGGISREGVEWKFGELISAMCALNGQDPDRIRAKLIAKGLPEEALGVKVNVCPDGPIVFGEK